MNKKGAIGLSMNILVVVILSIVILVGSIGLLYKFVGDTVDIKDSLDRKTQLELERLLTLEGKQVIVPFQKSSGQRGDQHIFGLGILNVGEESVFSVVVEAPQLSSDPSFKDQNGVQLLSDSTLYDETEFNLKQNENVKRLISVTIPVNYPAGTYSFSVKVYVGENGKTSYGPTQHLYVEVE